LKYTDPSGLIWGTYLNNDNQRQYHWYDDEKALKAAGAEIVAQDLIYRVNDNLWIRLDPRGPNGYGTTQQQINGWDAYGSEGQAVERTHGPMGDNSTAAAQAFELAAYDTGGRIVSGLAGSLFSALFGRTAAEATGVSTEGLAYEFNFVNKHLAGTSQAAKEVAREGSAHVFSDLSTLSRVEGEIFSRGVYTGTTRGFARYGVQFSEAIGERIGKDGTRTALNYGEMKLRENGLYHIIPRTGPSKWASLMIDGLRFGLLKVKM
jgi:Domain of unknown function (DUF6972)